MLSKLFVKLHFNNFSSVEVTLCTKRLILCDIVGSSAVVLIILERKNGNSF